METTTLWQRNMALADRLKRQATRLLNIAEQAEVADTPDLRATVLTLLGLEGRLLIDTAEEEKGGIHEP